MTLVCIFWGQTKYRAPSVVGEAPVCFWEVNPDQWEGSPHSLLMGHQKHTQNEITTPERDGDATV